MLCEKGEIQIIGCGQRFICQLSKDPFFDLEPCKYIKWCALKSRYEMIPNYEENCENLQSEKLNGKN